MHAVAEKADHGAVLPLVEGKDGKFAHAGGEEAIGEGRGRAPLEVAKNGEANFLLKLVFARGQEAVHEVLSGTGPFCNDDDAVVVATEAAAGKIFDNFFHIITEFGNDGDLRAGGDGAHQSKVAVFSTHNLHDKTAIMGGSSGLDHVNKVNHGIEAGIHADGHFGARQVVVDGTRNSEDTETQFGESRGASERTVSSQNEEGLNIFLPENVDGLELGFLLLKMKAAAGGKNGAGVANTPADFNHT